MQKRKVYFISAVAGAGKTQLVLKRAIELAQKAGKVCIIQETIDLIDETAKEIESKKASLKGSSAKGMFHVSTFFEGSRDHTESGKKGVVQALKAHFKDISGNRGAITLCTHKSLLLAYNRLSDQKKWRLFIDEVPSGVDETSKLLPRNHLHLKQLFDTEEAVEGFYRLTVKDSPEARRIGRNKEGDEIDEVFKELFDLAVGPYDLFIKARHWDNPMEARDKLGRKGYLTFFSILKPSVLGHFHEPTIMSANFEKSLLFWLWKNRYEVDFAPSRLAMDADLPQIHHNPYEMKMYWLAESRPSLHSFDKTIEIHGKSAPAIEHMIDACVSHFGATKVLLSINKAYESLVPPHYEQLPYNSKGRNGFDSHTKFISLKASNFSPVAIQFLQALGVPQNLISSRSVEEAYQELLRTAARKRDFSGVIEAVFASKLTATALAERFSRFELVGLLPGLTAPITEETRGRPSSGIAKTGRERQADYRKRQLEFLRRQEIEKQLKLIKEVDTYFRDEFGDGNSFTTTNKGFFVTQLGETFPHPILIQPFSKTEEAAVKESWRFANEDEFVQLLLNCSTNEFKNKHDNSLISPAVFGNVLNTYGNREASRRNILFAWAIYLDIDDGFLTPETFRQIFSKYRFYLYNTFSQGNRFRAIFPTSTYLTDYAYKDLALSLRGLVEKSGFTRPSGEHPLLSDHGIDDSKLSAASKMYLPCRAKTGEGDSFFISNPGEALDVLWFMNNPLHNEDPRPRGSKKPVIKPGGLERETPALVVPHSQFPTQIKSRQDVEQYARQLGYTAACARKLSGVIDSYWRVPAYQGKRHRAFYVCAKNIRSVVKDRQHAELLLMLADRDGSRIDKGEFQHLMENFW